MLEVLSFIITNKDLIDFQNLMPKIKFTADLFVKIKLDVVNSSFLVFHFGFSVSILTPNIRLNLMIPDDRLHLFEINWLDLDFNKQEPN